MATNFIVNIADGLEGTLTGLQWLTYGKCYPKLLI